MLGGLKERVSQEKSACILLLFGRELYCHSLFAALIASNMAPAQATPKRCCKWRFGFVHLPRTKTTRTQRERVPREMYRNGDGGKKAYHNTVVERAFENRKKSNNNAKYLCFMFGAKTNIKSNVSGEAAEGAKRPHINEAYFFDGENKSASFVESYFFFAGTFDALVGAAAAFGPVADVFLGGAWTDDSATTTLTSSFTEISLIVVGSTTT